jgi:alkylation response protein AidB-like acyl-CoA dehydrogenase
MGVSDSQSAYVERIDEVARTRIGPRAAGYDREGKNPVESWRDLWREGFLAAAIPAAYGGRGLDMGTYIAGLRAIARACANTAMTVHMHSTVMRFIDALGTDAQKRRYYAEVIEHGKLFGSWGSEPAVSLSRTFAVETALRRAGDGYAVDGIKHFCTMALGASYYMVWCALEGEPDMSKSILQALVPADSPGLHTDGKWDTLGMRATFSPTVELRDVRVSSDATLGEPGAALRVGVVEGFALGYAAVYTALAEAALAFAMEAVKKRVVKPENIPVSHDPAVQRHIGELEARLHAVLLVLGDAAARWDKADMAARGLLANRAKLLATEVGLAVTAHAIQTVGGRAAYKEFPIERAFRDMRTATLMPPTMDRMMEAIGKAALGLEATMFRVGGSPSA